MRKHFATDRFRQGSVVRADAIGQLRPGRSGKGDVIPITNPLKDKECGASPTAVGYQMRAPGTNRSPALARLEFHLFIGIAQSDPHAAAENVKGVLDAGVIVPGHPLRGCLSSPPSPAARPSWPVTARGGRATTETLRRRLIAVPAMPNHRPQGPDPEIWNREPEAAAGTQACTYT